MHFSNQVSPKRSGNCPLSDDLIVFVSNRLETLYSHAKSILHYRLGAKRCDKLICPTLTFNQRGKVAGSALLQRNQIRLNARLFHENIEYFYAQVLPHELAHILVFQLYGSRPAPHGKEWQGIMNEVFEVPAKVTHNLDVSSVAMKTYEYECACQRIDMTLIRHNKVIRNKQQYICRRCGSVFKWLKTDSL